MPIINLIQEQRVAELRGDQQKRMAMFCFVATVCFGVLGYGMLFFEQSACNAEISRLNQELQTNKPIVAQIELCKKKEDQLNPRLTTLSEAQKVSDKWADILKRLQTQTPSDTWLTGLQCPPVADDKPITLTFTGSATGQQPIGEFILRTQNEPFLENVQLHFTQDKRTMGGKKQIDFEMAADIVGSTPPKVQVKEDKA